MTFQPSLTERKGVEGEVLIDEGGDGDVDDRKVVDDNSDDNDKSNIGKKRKAKEIQIEKVRGNKQHIKSVETNTTLNIIYELLTCDNKIRIDTA